MSYPTMLVDREDYRGFLGRPFKYPNDILPGQVMVSVCVRACVHRKEDAP